MMRAGGLLVDPAIIFSSPSRAACEERSFVLLALGIASQLLYDYDERSWCLLVAPADVANATRQLAGYEREIPPKHRRAQSDVIQPYAWVAPVIYAALMLAVGYLAGSKALASDWLDAGAVDTVLVRGGEWWRAVTALTLHFDVGHLLSNLGFGMVFLLLAAQLLGSGVALAAVFASGTLANLINVWIQPADHFSAGASTAVFATLGLLAAFAWRRRSGTGERWAYRWAPLLAGVFLLAFTGAAGENTDVLAHLTGFAAGAAAGAALSTHQRSATWGVQWLCGGLTLLVIGASWWQALSL